MKKILIIIIILGCIVLVKNVYGKPKYSDNAENLFRLYIDEDTCVEYFVSYSIYNNGNVSPRYNADGTLKTNNKCLKNK